MLAENQVQMANEILTKDAGVERERLTEKAIQLMQDGTASCFSELYDHIAEDVDVLAVLIGKSPAYVMACTIDDVQAQLD